MPLSAGADLGYVESVGLTFLCVIEIDHRNKCVITINFLKEKSY